MHHADRRTGWIVLLAILTGCYSLPTAEEQARERAAEGIAPGYRLAVTAMQSKVDVSAMTFGVGLVPALFRELDEAISKARIETPGSVPIERLQDLVEGIARSELGADVRLLERTLYGANDRLAGSPSEADIFAAMDAARGRGDDGILFVAVDPEVRPQGTGGFAGYAVSVRVRAVLRSLRRDLLLLNHIETVTCNEAQTDDQGRSEGVRAVGSEEVPKTLLACYASIEERLRESLPAALAR